MPSDPNSWPGILAGLDKSQVEILWCTGCYGKVNKQTKKK